MNDDSNYDVLINIEDKWKKYGKIKKTKNGNWSLGIKVTEEFVSLVESKRGDWLNFYLFKERPPVANRSSGESQEANESMLNDEIPF